MDEQQRHRAQNLLIAQRSVMQTVVAVGGGLLLMKLTNMISGGGRDEYLPWVRAAGLLGAMFQLTSHYLFRRLGGCRRMCLVATSLQVLGWVAIASVPVFLAPALGKDAVWALMAFLLMTRACASVSEVGHMTWASEVVEPHHWGRYFSRMFRYMRLASGTVYAMALGLVVLSTRDGPGVMPALKVVFCGAAVLSFSNVVLVWRTPDSPVKARDDSVTTPRALGDPLRDKSFLPFVIFSAAWQFAIGYAAPLFIAFQFNFLDLDLRRIIAINAVGVVAGLYTIRFWGRLIDKFGARPMLVIGTATGVIFPVLWTLVQPQTDWLLAAIAALRAFTPAMELAMTNLSLKLSPESERPAYISVFRTVNSFSSAVSAVLGGLSVYVLRKHVLRGQWLRFLQWRFGPVHWVFLISAVLRLLTVPLAMMIKEPRARSVRTVGRVVSQIDGLTPMRGIGPFTRFWLAPLVTVRNWLSGGRRPRGQRPPGMNGFGV